MPAFKLNTKCQLYNRFYSMVFVAFLYSFYEHRSKSVWWNRACGYLHSSVFCNACYNITRTTTSFSIWQMVAMNFVQCQFLVLHLSLEVNGNETKTFCMILNRIYQSLILYIDIGFIQKKKNMKTFRIRVDYS